MEITVDSKPLQPQSQPFAESYSALRRLQRQEQDCNEHCGKQDSINYLFQLIVFPSRFTNLPRAPSAHFCLLEVIVFFRRPFSSRRHQPYIFSAYYLCIPMDSNHYPLPHHLRQPAHCSGTFRMNVDYICLRSSCLQCSG